LPQRHGEKRVGFGIAQALRRRLQGRKRVAGALLHQQRAAANLQGRSMTRIAFQDFVGNALGILRPIAVQCHPRALQRRAVLGAGTG
jgi:hypothetical protein